MSDGEDDYLSDKFLQQLTSASSASASKTYSQRRKDAQKQSDMRNLAGRTKSRKELDEEARERLRDGMATSLFEREKLAAAEGANESKAFKMMSKMGFKPGQTLGRQGDLDKASESGDAGASTVPQPAKRAVPISINFWDGVWG